MAIVSKVKEYRDGWEYSTEDLNGTRRFYVMLTGDDVEFEDYATIAPLVLSATDPVSGLSIPIEGSRLGDFETYATNISAKVHKNQNRWWDVDVTYGQLDSDLLSGGGGGSRPDDPTSQEITYDWDTKNIKETIWKDEADISIVMSSSEPPTKLPVVDKAVLTLQITRNTKTYTPITALESVNTINDAPVTFNGSVFPKGTVKCVRWAGKKEVAIVADGVDAPVEVVYDAEVLKFEILKLLDVSDDRVGREPWVGRMMDLGFNTFSESLSDGVPPGFHPIVKNGQNVKTPQPLDGLGHIITDSTGSIVSTPVPRAIDTANGVAGVEKIFGGKGAMLLFKFWADSDFSVFGAL